MRTGVVALTFLFLLIVAALWTRDIAEAQTSTPAIQTSYYISDADQRVYVNDTFTIRFSMRRTSGGAGHGGISISFPGLDQANSSGSNRSYDSPKASVVTDSYTNGSQGVSYFASGYSPINKADGTQGEAEYLLVETDDTDWPLNAYRTLELEVTPKTTGLLIINYRYWLCGNGYQNCTYDPDSGTVDRQQGWHVDTFRVLVRNREPTATRVSPSSRDVELEPGSRQTFTARGRDRDGNLSQVEWYLDDESSGGQSLVPTGEYADSATHSFPNAGTYRVSVTFTDTIGESDTTDWNVEVVEVSDDIDVTVTSDPPRRTITVDGTGRTTPYTTAWDSGTSLTLDAPSPQNVSGVNDRYVFSHWSHGGSQRQTVRPTTDTTYTANFTLQHFLSTRTYPRGIGIAGGGQWYDHGSRARVGPAPTLAGLQFSHWEKGDGEDIGYDPAGVLVTVDAAFLVVAVYTQASAQAPRIDSLGCAPTTVQVGQTVSCRPELSGGNPTEYDWDAIGGSPSSGATRNFSTRWDTRGTRRIDFEACNDSGCDGQSQTILVDPGQGTCFTNWGTLPTGNTSVSGSWYGNCASTHRSGRYGRFYAFALTQRTRVQIGLASSEDTYLYVLNGADSRGTVVDEDDDGGSTGNNSRLDLTLEAGTYTIEATTYDAGATGDFSLTIIVGTPEPVAACIQALTTASSPLHGVSPIRGAWTGHCSSEHRGGRYARYYTFTLPPVPPGSSRTVDVTLESFDADAYLYLLEGEGTDGRVIAENDNGPLQASQSQISIPLRGGTYTVEATTKEPGVSGQFSLTVSYTTVSVPSPRIDSTGCSPLEVLVGEVVTCRPTLSGGEPTRYLWGAIGGDPWSGTDETFSTQWDTPGEKQIAFEVCNDAGCDTGEESITVDAPPPPPPPVALGDPTNLRASPSGPGQVRLTWRTAPGAEVHWLWSVKVDGTGGKYTRASGTASTTTVVGLENGQNHWFIVIAGRNVNGVQEWSQWSQWANLRISGTAVHGSVSSAFASVSAGGYHTCGVREGGSVACWGDDGDGQATPPSGRFASVSAGGYHTCGVREGGSVACWGDDGDGRTTPPSGRFASVSAGGYHTCGVGEGGSVACWGDDSYGQSTPPAGRYSSVSAGEFLTCGVREEDTVVCWGGTYGRWTLPQSRFDSVSAGGFHVCGVSEDSSIACWGEDSYGQTNPPPGRFASVGGGRFHNCGVREGGSVDCWGLNDAGQSTPPEGRFSSVSAGEYHNCGLRQDGSVLCWGGNDSGQSTPPEINLASLDTADGDRAALLALYHATDGPNWANSQNWASDEPLDQWYGVTTNADGRVTDLDLDGNRLRGILPRELGSLSHLTYLCVGSNQLHGPIPAELSNLTSLTHLSVGANRLSGSMPPQFGNLSNLRELLLDENLLTGRIPSELGDLPNLSAVNLEHNQLTGEIPPALGNLRNLTGLHLYSNQLTGDITPALGNLSNLTSLRLSNNRLTGQIPVELGNLSNLDWLDLGDNRLSGRIPSTLANLASLGVLQIHGNELTGNIPSELGRLSNLGTLGLRRNRLTGEIPSELGNLADLTNLQLSNNRLSGEIPPELENLDLEWVSLAGNFLTGCVPGGLQDVPNNDFGALGLPFCADASDVAPDLIIDGWELSYPANSPGSSGVDPGTPFDLTFPVSNRGNGRSTGTTIRYYLSADAIIPSGDTEIANDPVSALGVNEEELKSISSTSPTSPGHYYYGACVDAVSGESNEHNNCSEAVPIVVRELSPVRIREETRCSWQVLPFAKFKLEGTVEATRSLSSVVIKGFVTYTNSGGLRKREYAGQQDLGSMSANSISPFSIATAGPADFAPSAARTHGCDYEFEWEP